MIIITGGAGFIGRNLIAGLNKIQYNNILVVDNLKNGKKYSNLIGLHIADYIDKSDFIKNLVNTSYIKNIKAIFHEGACSNTCEWDGKYMMYNNYQYSKELLHYCIQQSIPFIYASSASVYGKNTNFFNKKNKYEKPMNVYSYSKYLFDQYVQKTLPNITSQVCGLRYFNVYGPYEFHKGNMASIIYNIYTQIISNKHPTLFIGSKNFKRDFIYIDDIININLWIWKNKISGIFDCGTGISKSFAFITKIILNFFHKQKIQYIPIPQNLQKHYQTFTKANSFQLRNIGYTYPFTKIHNGIHKYLNWLTYYHNR